jgi:stage II sporulation protein R
MKIIRVIALCIGFSVFIGFVAHGAVLESSSPQTEVLNSQSKIEDQVMIPDEAIRLRILANSDTDEDQALKRKIRDEVNAQISIWVQDMTDIEDAREIIRSKLPTIQLIAEKVLERNHSNQTARVKFGQVDFPTKLYGDFLYPAGKYEALLITVGKGEGANWWCVLYPPLCFLDFSTATAAPKEKTPSVESSEKRLDELSVDRNEEVTIDKKKESKKKEMKIDFLAVKWFKELFGA